MYKQEWIGMIKRTIKISEDIKLEITTQRRESGYVVTEAKGYVAGEYVQYKDYYIQLNKLNNPKASKKTIENAHNKMLSIFEDICIRGIKDFYNLDQNINTIEEEQI